MKFDDATKSRIMTVSRSKLMLRCPKHTRYNPAQGRGAIVGVCPGCIAALDAYEAVCGFRQALARYVCLTEKYETTKPRQKKEKLVVV